MLSVLNGAIRLSWNSCCGGRNEEEEQQTNMYSKPLPSNQQYFDHQQQQQQNNQYLTKQVRDSRDQFDPNDIDSVIPNYESQEYVSNNLLQVDSADHQNSNLAMAQNINNYQQQKTVKEEYRSKKHSSKQQNSSQQQQLQQKNGKSVRTKNWSDNENKLLKYGFQKYPNNWDAISQFVGTRNAKQCKQRWNKVKPVDENKKKKPWGQEEDEMIKKMIDEFGDGERQWGVIAQRLGTGRNGKQVRERYINVLDTCIRRGGWTEEEDEIILKMFHQIGTKWSEISKYLEGRPENMVKNRFHSHIKKRLNDYLHDEIEMDRENMDSEYESVNGYPHHYENHNNNNMNGQILQNGNGNHHEVNTYNGNSYENSNHIQQEQIPIQEDFNNINNHNYEDQQQHQLRHNDVKLEESDYQQQIKLEHQQSLNNNNGMELEGQIQYNGNGVLQNSQELQKKQSVQSNDSLNMNCKVEYQGGDHFFLTGDKKSAFSLNKSNSTGPKSWGSHVGQNDEYGNHNDHANMQDTLKQLRLQIEDAKQSGNSQQLQMLRDQLLNIQDSLPYQ